MKTIKKIHLYNIEMNFQYEDQFITLKVEPFKTLNEVKDKAIKKMICVPNNIKCFYSNIDLSNDENKKIGDIFNHKEKVTIKLKNLEEPNSVLSIPKYLNNNNSSPNIKDLLRLNKNNNKKIFIPKIKSIDRNNLRNNFLSKNSSLNTLRIPKTDIHRLTRNRSEGTFGILPSVRVRTNRRDYIKNINVCQCGNNPVSNYCRTCQKFICNECKSNDNKHKNHLIIRIDLHNLDNNINLYGNIIQTDIKKTIDLNRNILQNKNKIIDINSFKKLKEDMKLKFQNIMLDYNNIMKKIQKYLEKEKHGKIKLLINAYNSSSVKIHKEIYDLIESMKEKYNDNNQRQIKFNELEYYLNELNNKEATLSFFKKDIIKFYLTNEINDIIKNTYNKINNILDEIINEDNPFNLDKKYYPDLVKMKIIKPKKFSENNNNINKFELNTNNRIFSK